MVLVAFTLIAAGCGDDTDATETTEVTVEETTTTSLAAESTVDPQETTTTTDGTSGGSIDGVDGVENALPVEAEWENLGAPWFVWNVRTDDTLNVRSAPGVDSEVLGTLPHDLRGVTVYSPWERVGGTAWAPIGFGDGAGWVSLDFLRPEPSVDEIETQGTIVPDLESATAGVIDALVDPAGLAGFVGAEGLLLSPDGFVADDDVVLSIEELETNSGVSVLWGFTDGVGDPIELPLEPFLQRIAGSTALTSTEAIGYDTVIGSGSTINNVADEFPGATIVEYHYTGTEFFAGLDWESVRFVWDTSGDGPILLAIVQDAWTT